MQRPSSPSLQACIPHRSRQSEQAAVNCSPLSPKGAQALLRGEEGGYAPLGRSPEGQDAPQGVQVGLHGESCRSPLPGCSSSAQPQPARRAAQGEPGQGQQGEQPAPLTLLTGTQGNDRASSQPATALQ